MKKVLRVIRLPKNKGLGTARRIGVENASNELVAMMDADDICTNTRFEKQLEIFRTNKNIDVVGGQIVEFINDTSNIIGIRKLQKDYLDKKKFMKSRCPFKHVTVMAKKKSILDAGNYRDLLYHEDYYLWLRMFLKNCRFYNLETPLVYVKVGKEMYARRSGKKYFLYGKRIQKFMKKNGIIGSWDYIKNLTGRFIVQVLLPPICRELFYKCIRKTKIKNYNYEETTSEIRNKIAPFTVIMNVYINDNPEEVESALQSVLRQTYVPDEIIIVIDGPISKSLNTLINSYENKAIEELMPKREIDYENKYFFQYQTN